MSKNRHHRKCKINGGSNTKRNISIVKKTEHQLFHAFFGTLDTFGIAQKLNETWVDPSFKLIVVKR